MQWSLGVYVCLPVFTLPWPQFHVSLIYVKIFWLSLFLRCAIANRSTIVKAYLAYEMSARCTFISSLVYLNLSDLIWCDSCSFIFRTINIIPIVLVVIGFELALSNREYSHICKLCSFFSWGWGMKKYPATSGLCLCLTFLFALYRSDELSLFQLTFIVCSYVVPLLYSHSSLMPVFPPGERLAWANVSSPGYRSFCPMPIFSPIV